MICHVNCYKKIYFTYPNRKIYPQIDLCKFLEEFPDCFPYFCNSVSSVSSGTIDYKKKIHFIKISIDY